MTQLKFVDNAEAKTLIECYKLGCVMENQPVNTNDMLDLILLAEHIRAYSALLQVIILGNLPCYFKTGVLTIACDKAASLDTNKQNGVTK